MSVLVPGFVKPPLESQSFVPSAYLIFHGKGKAAQRFLFTDQELTPFENEKLSRLEQELKTSNINPFAYFPHWTRNDLLRFCYGTGWKTRVAKETFCKYLKWKQKTMPGGHLALYPKISKIIETGCLYIHGRDMHYRPIIVINFNRFNLKKFLFDEYVILVAFTLDYAIENMMLPGKIENWVVISDFEKNGFGELGFGQLKHVLGLLTDNYRCRLGCNYVVNPAKSVYYMWSCLKPFLDDVLLEKVKILNKSVPEELFTHSNPYQVEEKYGGRAPNARSFWPPILPKAPYTVDGSPGLPVPEEIQSCESELNPPDEPSKMRRSLSTSGAFEVRINQVEESENTSKAEFEQIDEEEEELKRLKKERRKQRRLKKELKKIERIKNEEIAENIEKVSEVSPLYEAEDIDQEKGLETPVSVLKIGSDHEGIAFENTKADVGCGVFRNIGLSDRVKVCTLF